MRGILRCEGDFVQSSKSMNENLNFKASYIHKEGDLMSPQSTYDFFQKYQTAIAYIQLNLMQNTSQQQGFPPQQQQQQQQQQIAAGGPQQQAQQHLNIRLLSQFLNPQNQQDVMNKQLPQGNSAQGQLPLNMISPQLQNRTIQHQVMAAALQGQASQQPQQQSQQQQQQPGLNLQQQLLQQQQQQLAAQRLAQAQAQAQVDVVQAQVQLQQPMVREVWADNLESEMLVIRELAERYNHISVSTEFAGIVSRPIGSFRSTKDYHYQTMRSNADLLNMVQIGITLSDEEGTRPERVSSTWQFNFKFDLEKEMFTRESIDALITTGMNFNRLKENGIDPFVFAQALTDSGLCLLKDVTWISFHAGYDFGFLLSALLNRNMPFSEEEFVWWLKTYFPNHYDIKIISKFVTKSPRPTLESLAEELGVIRNVNLAFLQVGGQSVLTHLCFWEMKRLLNSAEFSSCKNQIWGLTGKDEETNVTSTPVNAGNTNGNALLNVLQGGNTGSQNYFGIGSQQQQQQQQSTDQLKAGSSGIMSPRMTAYYNRAV